MALRGNCYVTVEALYHLLGGKASGWVPHRVRHEGDTHWFLAKFIRPPGTRGSGAVGPVIMPIMIVLDPTAAQFKNPPRYERARGCGFLTKDPSARARELMDRLLWQEYTKPRRRSKKR